MEFGIGAVTLAALIFGITEAFKEFGVEGKASRAVVFFVGVVFVGLAYAKQQGVVPEEAMQWINIFVTALAGGLAAMGYYDFDQRRRTGD